MDELFWTLYYKISLQCYHKDAEKCKYLVIKRFFSLDNSTIYANWTKSMGFCKENGTYLAGNFNLSNATSACFEYAHTSPRWIGAFRENYYNTDQGNQFKGRHIIFSIFFLSFKFRPKLWLVEQLIYYLSIF